MRVAGGRATLGSMTQTWDPGQQGVLEFPSGRLIRGRGLLNDAIALRYNPTRREPGSSAPGTYAFPERRRYAARADFR